MADLNFKYVDVPNQQERTPEDEMSEAAATRSRLFGADLVPENPNKHLHSTLHERFRAWDTRQIRWQQFIFEVEQLIEKPVEPELETYVRNVDEGRLPSSFRDFLSKLLQGKNSLAGLKMPRAQTDDSAKAIIQDNSGEKQPQCVAGQPVIGRTDLAQDDFLRAEACMQGRPRRTNQSSYANPLQPEHEGDGGPDIEVIIRMFLNLQMKEHEFRQLVEARGVQLGAEADRLIRRFVDSGDGNFATFRRVIR